MDSTKKAGIDYGMEKPTASDPKGFSIFDFSNYRKFLQAYYDYKKRRYYGFSYRSFNKLAGVKSPGLFLDLIQGRQKMNQSLHRKFSDAMKLSVQESEYLWLMIMMTHAQERGDNEVKKDFIDQMALLKPSQSKVLTVHQETYFRVWYNTVVREALGILEVKDDYGPVASFLNPEVTADQVREAVNLLRMLNLITRDKSGRWLPESASVTAHGSDIPASTIHQFQKNLLDLGKRALEAFPKEERNISASIFSLSKEGAEKIRKKADLFRKQVLDIVQSDEGPDRVFALSLLFFPLTGAKAEKGIADKAS